MKILELTGASSKLIVDAMDHATEKAAEAVRRMRWFKVTEIRGRFDGIKKLQRQVTIRVGFALDD